MPEIAGVDLGRKIGPFPLSVWLVVGAGGIGLAYFLNRGGLLGGGGTSGAGGGTIVESGVGGLPGGFVPAAQPGEEEGGILDNEMWALQAVAYLVSQNYPIVEASVAVRRFLDGEMLDSSQATMIQIAAKQLGPPPTIPVGGGVTPAPQPPPPTGSGPPGKPGNLRAENVTRRQATFRWDAVPGATAYQLQRVAPGSIAVLVLGTTYRSRALSPFKGNTFHEVRVRALNASGFSPWTTIRFKTK